MYGPVSHLYELAVTATYVWQIMTYSWRISVSELVRMKIYSCFTYCIYQITDENKP